MLALLLAMAPLAHARCAISREAVDDGARIVVEALAEPVRCAHVEVSTSGPTLSVQARHVDAYGRGHRVKGGQLRHLPGHALAIDVPELEPGGRLVLDVAASDVQIRLGAPPTHTPPGRVDLTREVLLDADEPSYGFVLPRLARTKTTFRWEQGDPTDPLRVPFTPGSTLIGCEGATCTAGGAVATSPRGQVTWESPGAAPTGADVLGAGTLTLRAPGVRWALHAPPDAEVTELPGEVHVTLPNGGRTSWRAVEVAGTAVTGDAQRMLAGLDWRFARVSLPEPAVPVNLRNIEDRDELLKAVFAEVQGLRHASVVGADALHPRPLLRAWRSGWATSVERALILHRMLTQEKFEVRWVLTGARAPDPLTFDGFDRALVVVTHAGHELWLDPTCVTCAEGEVSPDLAGMPILGGGEVPYGAGALVRRLALHDADFVVSVRAEGGAATWLREGIAREEEEQRERRLLERAGLPDAHLTAIDGLAADGSALTFEAHTRRPPRAVCAAREPRPWRGNCNDDALAVEGAPGIE